jgi:hypothetical protein
MTYYPTPTTTVTCKACGIEKIIELYESDKKHEWMVPKPRTFNWLLKDNNNVICPNHGARYGWGVEVPWK